MADRVLNRRPDTYAQALNFANDAHAGQKILNQAVPPQPKEEPGLFHIGQGEHEDGGAAAIGAARRRGAGGRCFGCDKTGHQVRDCPLLRNLLHGRGKGGGRCAGGRGHVRGGVGGRARERGREIQNILGSSLSVLFAEYGKMSNVQSVRKVVQKSFS